MMIKYAANDVFYLLKVYELMKNNLDCKKYDNLTYDAIYLECQRYLHYPKINLVVKNYNKQLIPVGSEIEGLLK